MKNAVCVVTFPLSEAGYAPLSNLVNISSKIANIVYVVSGGAALEKIVNSDLADVQTVNIAHRVSTKLLMRIFNYLQTQLKILGSVITISRKVNVFVFFIGGEALTLPMLSIKLLRKKVLLMPGGIASKGYSIRRDPLSKFFSLLSILNFGLADRLVIYSYSLIKEASLAKYHRKTIIMHEHFVDFTAFTIAKAIDERPNAVGYIGRLSAEKGVLNLVDAMPLVREKKTGIHLTVCGDGELADQVVKRIKNGGLEDITNFTKWIPHEEVPRYLNDIKLLVLPSITEGMPNILLEAMACGTPVLSTSVGAVPDIIKDCETGFLLESNNPTHIADKIIALLNNPELLSKVSVNAYKLVRDNFSKEKTVEVWRKVLLDLREWDE
jgi:glycosyltransferase involved in cell wall biosynthesis